MHLSCGIPDSMIVSNLHTVVHDEWYGYENARFFAVKIYISIYTVKKCSFFRLYVNSDINFADEINLHVVII